MYLWRRRAGPKWFDIHGAELRARARGRLVVIEQPGQTTIALEVVCPHKKEAVGFVHGFQGRAEVFRDDWLSFYNHQQRRAPLRVGKRLVIVRAEKRGARPQPSVSGPAALVIPAGTAFGTGEHSTTAMSLRLLEEVTRRRKPPWSIADLGTGSGILALAARVFGASVVRGLDNDAQAISVAKSNAHLNRVRGVHFEIADATTWRPAQKIDVVTANLFSELLIVTLPTIRRYIAPGGDLILSGVMRSQEKAVGRALRQNGFALKEIRRRGKWIALLGHVCGVRASGARKQKPS